MNQLGMEIDCQLFILCRLCLEDNGVYQIVPSVQEQINYCFGIFVEHFDGLPQLVCKKCKLLLNEYSINKKKFVVNQDTLKRKLEENSEKDNVPEPTNTDLDTITSNQDNYSDEINTLLQQHTKLRKNKKKRKRVLSTSSSDSFRSSITTIKKRKKQSKKEIFSEDWQKNYFTNFTCRLCSKSYSNRGNVYRHYKKNHNHIKAKHCKMLDLKCMVSLEKLDSKPNLTGLTNTVVLSRDKIVQDDGLDYHYIVYVSREKKMDFDIGNASKNIDSDSSDDVCTPKNRKNMFRLDSRSSTDTVFIGNNNIAEDGGENDKLKLETPNKKVNENKQFEYKDTICIDSSDSDMELTSRSVTSKLINDKTETKTTIEIDEKIVKDIISVCRKKYEARTMLLMADTLNIQQEAQLKHKILSIGRKVINRKGFNNCTGLLRYLEHKNLSVVWDRIPEMQSLNSKEANLVRMLIKNSKQKTIKDDVVWIDLDDEGQEESNALNMESSVTTLTYSDVPIQIAKSPLVSHQIQIEKQSHIGQDSSIMQRSQFNQHTAQKKNIACSQPLVQQPQIIQQPQAMDQAVLYTNIVEDTNTKKLLNPFPVANPKQLPKKMHLNDTKASLSINKPSVSNNTVLVNLVEQVNESNMVLPVITSTTSLAKINNDSKKYTENVNVSKNTDKPAPRIKVKPASELMKPTSMMSIAVSQPSNIWGFTQVQNEPITNENIVVPNNLVSQIQNQSAPIPGMAFPTTNLLPIERVTSEGMKNDSDYVILDTVDFPNTKTDSPFKYLRNLLLLYGIILTETNAPLTTDFVCLIKFRVQFKQENKNLTLCLSLHCSENKFCISVRDGNQTNIQMPKMSANWQWEIIKVFQGDVTAKILDNAEKAGHFPKTRSFLCHVKSINQKLI